MPISSAKAQPREGDKRLGTFSSVNTRNASRATEKYARARRTTESAAFISASEAPRLTVEKAQHGNPQKENGRSKSGGLRGGGVGGEMKIRPMNGAHNASSGRITLGGGEQDTRLGRLQTL